MRVFHYIALIIGIGGIATIVWGSVVSFFELVRLEFQRVKGGNVCKKREYLRHHFGFFLLLGLEFLIAADIIQTIIRPTLRDLAILGSIVTIRTVLSFFLDKEMAGKHNCQEM